MIWYENTHSTQMFPCRTISLGHVLDIMICRLVLTSGSSGSFKITASWLGVIFVTSPIWSELRLIGFDDTFTANRTHAQNTTRNVFILNLRRRLVAVSLSLEWSPKENTCAYIRCGDSESRDSAYVVNWL